MVIKASAAGEIRQLIAALAADDDVRREAAIARLAIIGARAVDRLIAAYEAASERDTRVAILRALESSGDVRIVAVARRAILERGDIAVAAAGALRSQLDSPHAPVAADALDALVSVALDPTAERRVRLAAFDALQEIPEGVRERVAAALQSDRDRGIKERAAELPRQAAAAEAAWSDALDGSLPDDPAVLRDLIHHKAPSAALTALQKLVEAVRAREATARSAARRAGWRALRGALHQALALRGSRIAVYDLRESLETAQEPLPVSFLAALHVVGDAACLVPLAAAYANASAADATWRHQLASAFRAISRRERISRRHAAIRKISARWPDLVGELMGS
jgi:hypothetical protein